MQWFGLGMGRWLRFLASIAILSSCFGGAQQDDLKSLVQHAFDLHQKGEFSQALPLLHRAHDLQPDDYFVNLLLGIDSLRTGPPQTAIPFLKKASHLRPKEEFPLAYLGEAYARQGVYGDAAAAYIKAAHGAGSVESSVAFVDFALSRFATTSELLRSSQQGLAAEYRLRAMSLRANDASRRELFQRSADLDPAASGIWSDLARAALEGGDLVGADRYSQQALEADSNDEVASIAKAQLAAQASDWKKATDLLNSVAQRSPKLLSKAAGQWPTQLQPPPTAEVSGAAAKFFSCAHEAKTSCELPPVSKVSAEGRAALYREQRWEQVAHLPEPPASQVAAWLQRGVAFAHLDDCPQAIPSLERGLAKSAPEIYGMYLLSWCYSREAGRTADQVQQSGSNDAPLHVMRGDVLLRLQAQPHMAMSEYQLAVAQEPNDPGVMERLAEAQFGAGKIDDARHTAQATLKIDPRRPAAKRTLARIAMQERDYAAALPYLRDLAAGNAQDVSTRIDLGRACAQTGALEEARENLGPPLAHGYPDEKGSLHYLLATVLKKLGRTAEAEQAFGTAARLSDAFQQKSYRGQDSDAQP